MRHGRSFRRLVATQFLTVCNDNLFKQTVLLIAIARQGAGGDAQALAQALFALPMVLFAVPAGDCADRFAKRSMVLGAKCAEVGVMLMATWALAAGHLAFGMAVLFLMATQSAFLGPAKYGSLPEHAAPAELPRANGLFQVSVLAGILLGTGSAGYLDEAARRTARPWLPGALMVAVAAVGAFLAARIARMPAAAPGQRIRWNPLPRLTGGLREAARWRGLPAALLGHALFWGCGSLMLIAWNELIADDPVTGRPLVQAGRGDWSMGLAALSLFMAAGAWVGGLAGRIPRLLPVAGALGMAAGFAAATLVPARPWPVFLAVAAAAFFSGFYVIPLRTLIQRLPPPGRVGSVLGTGQMFDFLSIMGGALLRPALRAVGVDAFGCFLVLAALLAGAAALVAAGLPRQVALSADGSAR